ncbi:hypothetical protein D3C72_2096230 [compost metagenome]
MRQLSVVFANKIVFDFDLQYTVATDLVPRSSGLVGEARKLDSIEVPVNSEYPLKEFPSVLVNRRRLLIDKTSRDFSPAV